VSGRTTFLTPLTIFYSLFDFRQAHRSFREGVMLELVLSKRSIAISGLENMLLRVHQFLALWPPDYRHLVCCWASGTTEEARDAGIQMRRTV